MKKYIVGSIIALLIFSISILVKVYMTGTNKLLMGASLVNLEVPKLSFLSNESGENTAKFNSFRSQKSLEKEFTNMYSNYEMCFVEGDIYYYNKDSNITIVSYKIEKGFLLNSFIINYKKGNACK